MGLETHIKLDFRNLDRYLFPESLVKQ